ncbi:MAG: class I SAM-dependent methyltransferase [Tissierellia bacterium]|nr:class I SAM-dependent methyltransferase [Tissierellia bacterium]
MDREKKKIQLQGVAETFLWTLYNRAMESKGKSPVLKDPMAEEIFDQIDYPYEQKFGAPNNLFHPIRSRIFDEEIESFIKQYPDGVIVNLGEGLETHRFRVKANGNLWVTVDLPEAIRIREMFITPDARHIHLACSALDRRWMEMLDPKTPTLINAQGLLMYFKEDEVKNLIQEIGHYFDRATMVFDVINERYSKQTVKGYRITKDYMAPPMPWGINRKDAKKILSSWCKEIQTIEEIHFYFPYGWKKGFFRMAYRLPWVKDYAPLLLKVHMEKK